MMKKTLDDVISKLYDLQSELVDGFDNRSAIVKECVDSLSDIKSDNARSFGA